MSAANVVQFSSRNIDFLAVNKKQPEQLATTYVAALGYPAGKAFADFDSIIFEEPNNEAAITHALEWARKHTTGIDVRTWLQVTRKQDGYGIFSEHIGKDYA
jgi:hypothetical protein